MELFWLVTGEIHLGVEIALKWAGAEILRHIDKNRSGASRRRDVKCFAYETRDVGRSLYKVAMLHHRHRNVVDVGFLKGVLAKH